jgi:hypothetical protein
LGRHQQAFDEAKSGCMCVDELWRTMAYTRNGAESADFESMDLKTRKLLQDALINPPAWLEQAVEVTVQVRQQYASEAEVTEDNGLPFQFHHKGMYKRDMSNVGPISPSHEIDPKTPKTVGTDMWDVSEIDRLHSQAVSLARNLVPGSPVHVASERRKLQVDARRQGDSTPSALGFSSSLSSLPTRSFGMGGCSTTNSLEGMPSLLSRHAKGRLPFVNRVDDGGLSSSIYSKQKWVAGPSATASTTYASLSEGRSDNDDSQTLMSASMPNLSASLSVQSNLLSPTKAGGPVPSKEVPQSPRTQKGGRSRQTLKEIQKQIDQQHILDEKRKAEELQAKEQARREAEAKKANPFDVWRKTMADLNRMTLKQMHNRTDEGQVKLKIELAHEATSFKALKMPTISDDLLYDTRVINSGHGKQTQKRCEQHKLTMRALMYPPREFEKRIIATEKEQFEQFGVPIIKTGPGQLRNMNKVLRLACEQTPHGRLQQEAARAERRKKEEEEKAKRQEEKVAGLMGMRENLPLGQTKTE